MNIKSIKEQIVVIKKLKEELKTDCNQLTVEDFNDVTYDEMKSIYNEIKFVLNNDNITKLSDVLEEKKKEKFPELSKATYYPEINNLDISDKERLRLDKAARNSHRLLIYEGRLKLGLYSELSQEDVDLLYSIGILKRYYDFKSPAGNSSARMSEDELNKYKRIWELEEKRYDLTEDESKELDLLYGEYCCGCIQLYDINDNDDDYFKEIADRKALDEYKENIDIYYKFSKVPDLTYEKL